MDVSAGAWGARDIWSTETGVPGGSEPPDMVVGLSIHS